MTAIGKKNRKNQFARLPAYSYNSKKKHAKETRKKIKTNTRNSLYNNLLLFYDV